MDFKNWIPSIRATHCTYIRNLEEISITEKLSASGLCGSVAGRKSINSEESPKFKTRNAPIFFSIVFSISHILFIQAPTEVVFQNLLSVLKIYSAHNENYRFSVLAVNFGTQLESYSPLQEKIHGSL